MPHPVIVSSNPGGWIPRKIDLIDGVDFYLVGEVVSNIMHVWIYIVGSPLEAKKYSYTLSIKNQGNLLRDIDNKTVRRLRISIC